MGSSSVGGGKSKAGGKMPKMFKNMIQEFYDQTGPMREEVQSQMMEALTTGGSKAQIPIIQRAEEAQRRASSQALRGTEESLAQKGLAGTPFGEQIRGQQELSGRQAVAGVGPGISAQMIQGIPGYTMGATQSVMGSLAGTRQTQAESKSYM